MTPEVLEALAQLDPPDDSEVDNPEITAITEGAELQDELLKKCRDFNMAQGMLGRNVHFDKIVLIINRLSPENPLKKLFFADLRIRNRHGII